MLLLLLLLLLVVVAAQCIACTTSLVAHVHVLVAPSATKTRGRQLNALRIGVGYGEPTKVLRAQILPKLPALGLGPHQRNAVALLEAQLILSRRHVGIQRLHQWTLIATLQFSVRRLLLNDLMFAACEVKLCYFSESFLGLSLSNLTCQRGIASHG